MQSTIGCLSRLVSRSLVTGVVSNKESSHPKYQARLVTAVSGFPKQKTGYNIDNILNGQIGEDAYFVARHVDDWDSNNNNNSSIQNNENSNNNNNNNNNNNSSSIQNNEIDEEPFEHKSCAADVIGVADGVGGWRQYGVDPGQFSKHLMVNCERLVKSGYFSPNQPAKLLAQGFREMKENKKQIIGSSTACVMMLSHAERKLYTANIGDSGFMIVRDGQVIHRSHEQQHSFNTPFQLSLPPSELASDVLSDRPESADPYELNVEDGDVILLATDGIFDNVPVSLLVDEITTLSSQNLSARTTISTSNLAVELQKCANSIALIARKLSQDPNFLSPFSKSAQRCGFANMIGGKEDDITVLLAAVRLSSADNFYDES